MQYHYYLYGMRVTADLDFVQLDPVRLPEDDRDFGREKVRIRAMDEEEETQFRKEHGDCVCGSFLGTEKGWLCNRTLAMSVERGQVIRYHIRKGDAAARYLKELKDSGEGITPKAWQREIDQLTAGKQTDTLAMKAMREDLKAVERLRKTAEQLSRQERDKSHDRGPDR